MNMDQDVKKFLISLAIFFGIFVVFISTAGAIKAGGIHLWAGLLNGAAELFLLIKLIIKLMNNDMI